MSDRLQRVLELRHQLELMGYYGYQIDSIIKDYAETTDLNSMSDQQVTELIAELEGYVKFARKCREKKI